MNRRRTLSKGVLLGAMALQMLVAHHVAQAEQSAITIRVTAPADEPFQNVVAVIDAVKGPGIEIQLAVRDDDQSGIAAEIAADPDVPHERVVVLLDKLSMVKTVTIAVRENESGDTPDWQPFSLERLELCRRAKRPTLVFVAADWCLTCQQLKQTVFKDPNLVRSLQQHQVKTLLADYTEPSEVIKEFLSKQGKPSVPMIVYFPNTEEAKPAVLREQFSVERLMELIDGSVE